MKALHYCTASIYTADYRSYGYLAPDGRDWRTTSSSAEQLVRQASPSQQWPTDGLGCVDPRLNEALRLTVLLEQSTDGRQWCLAATVAGLKSSSRADFTGRRIRDGLHVTACGSLTDQAALQEAIQAVRAIWRLARDPSLSLDTWCCSEAFAQDLIPFPPADALWRHLVEAGARPLVQSAGSSQGAVEPRSRPSQTHLSQVHRSEAHHSQAQQRSMPPPCQFGVAGGCSVFSLVDRLLSRLSELPEKLQSRSSRFDILAEPWHRTSSGLRELGAQWFRRPITRPSATAPWRGTPHPEEHRDAEDPSDQARLERLLIQLQQGRLHPQRVLLML